MAPLDPFEESWLQEEAEAAEKAAEASSLASPRQPHYAPPIPSDLPPPLYPQVPPPPYSSDDSESDEDDDEEDDKEKNTEVQIADDATTRRRLKEAEAARMQKILSTFTEAQMKRYEAFRRSALRKRAMNRLLTKIFEKDVTKVVGQDASKNVIIVVSALAKMFTGDLVEKARVVMTERNDSGPIRPCHIRESYRRLKLEGMTFKPKSVPRLFY